MCLQLRKVCHKIRQLHRRELPTTLHKKAWMSYETILMYRTNVSFFMRFLNEVIVYMLGDSVIDHSKKYIADGKQLNEKYVESTF